MRISDWSSDVCFLRSRQHHDMFRKEVHFQPKAAADVRRDDPNGRFRHSEDVVGELGTEVVNSLRCGVKRQASARGIPISERRPRLEWVWEQPRLTNL